jgi:hypothetical protein
MKKYSKVLNALALIAIIFVPAIAVNYAVMGFKYSNFNLTTWDVCAVYDLIISSFIVFLISVCVSIAVVFESTSSCN